MSDFTMKRRRLLFLGAALVITTWGTVGFHQGLHSGFSGGLYDLLLSWYHSG